MIKHSAFLYNPPNAKKKPKKTICRKKMVLYKGRNNINSKLIDKG